MKNEKPGPGAAADKNNYPAEAVVIEKMDQSYRFENDGTGLSTVHARIRVQTQAGVQELGQLVFGYNSANEKFEVVDLRVIKPDGRVVPHSAENDQDVASQIERLAPSYTDYRERHITVAALRPGDILEYTIRTTTTKPLIPGQFWFEHAFQKEAITLDEQLTIDVPANRFIKLKTTPEYPTQTSMQGDRRIYTWKSNFLKRDDDEKNKKKEAERRRRQAEDFVPDIQLTTFKSWDEFGKWFASIEKTQMEPSAEVKEKALELTKDAKTDAEKARAIYDFVAQDYRYVSLSFGTGRFQPHAASQTFAEKYGDCKDKHTLLASMLKAVGLNADPVLISTERNLDPEVPSPAQFNHVITAIMPAVPQSSTPPQLWADSTTEIAPFGLLVPQIRKKKALLVSMDASVPSRVIETPADTPFPTFDNYSVEAKLTEIGQLSGRVKMTMRGDTELSFRSVFRMVPEAKWKDMFKYLSTRADLGDEVSDYKIDNLLDTHKPLHVEFAFSRGNYFDWSSKNPELTVPLPATTMNVRNLKDDSSDDDSDSTDSAANSGNANADKAAGKPPKPLILYTPDVETFDVKLELPERFKSRLPVPISVSRDYAAFQSAYKLDGHTLIVHRELTTKMHELPQERDSDLRSFIASLQADSAQKIHIETGEVSGAAAIPADTKASDLIDAAGDAVKNHNYSLAIELLKRATTKEPKNQQAWELLGAAYAGNRQFSEAEAAFRKLIEIDPFHKQAYMRLGYVLEEDKQYPEAETAFKKQLEVNPLDEQANAGLGGLYSFLKRYPEAVEAYEKATSIDPENAFLLSELGNAYLYSHRETDAMDAYERALKHGDGDPTLYNNIAYSLAENNTQLDRAQQYAESAVQAAANFLRNTSLDAVTLRHSAETYALGTYWDTLGWVYYKKGDLKNAEKYIDAAWKLTQHGECGDHLAEIYMKQGRKEDALRLYAEAQSGVRPLPTSRAKLVSLAGGEAQAAKLIARYRPEVDNARSYKVPGAQAPPNSAVKSVTADNGSGQSEKSANTSADVLLLLSQPGKVDSVKFLSGSSALKALGANLQSIGFGTIFPDDTPTKLLRRGVVTCGTPQNPSGCDLVLLQPDAVTSVD